ncbi:MAG: NAD(+) synthase [Anaerolineae bacterium]
MYDLEIDAALVARQSEQFIQEQVDRLERDGVILGVSGGIDSVVAAVLATRALGADQVLGLLLPERDSSPHSSRDGRLLMDQLGVRFEEVDLTPTLEALGIYRELPLRLLVSRERKARAVRATLGLFRRRLGENPFLTGLRGTRGRPGRDLLNAGHAYARTKRRARMVTLYFRAELQNRLVLGAVNRTEMLTGSMVKWGDSAADAQPLSRLFKTQVRELAHVLNVPDCIIEKRPTADLLPGVDDEMAYGVRYEVLDRVLYGLERGDQQAEIAGHAETDLKPSAPSHR